MYVDRIELKMSASVDIGLIIMVFCVPYEYRAVPYIIELEIFVCMVIVVTFKTTGGISIEDFKGTLLKSIF